MSDVMLFGVLRMPYEMAMGSELSRRQFYERAQEAANRLEGLNAAEWMPIETAPRDGADVLVCGGTYSVGLHSDIPLTGVVIAFWDKSHWHGPEANALDEWCKCAPTHWMPLPPPPTDRRTPEQPA